ncbi:MAG: TlpA disulfide reductase family protein [Bryobacteraceae bacterium]
MKLQSLLFVPLFTALASAGIIEDVREAIAKSGEAATVQKLQSYRTSQGITAEYLEAFSWLARAQYNAKRYAQAAQTAEEVYDLCRAELKKRPLDSERHLPIALGAAIEVQAGGLAGEGRRAEAVSFLQDEVKKYIGTSIQTRVQKNLLLLTLEGKPAPALEGVVLPKGKPAVIFFWAHWCPDCKAEAPILKRIRAEYGPKGLTVIAPTQKYGYTVRGEDASAAVEVAYIEQIRKQYYEGVIDGPAPVSEANFVRYGASTTPTMVVVDRAGVVRVYHPGAMKYEELEQALKKLM